MQKKKAGDLQRQYQSITLQHHNIIFQFRKTGGEFIFNTYDHDEQSHDHAYI
jgi:hypothetical protein